MPPQSGSSSDLPAIFMDLTRRLAGMLLILISAVLFFIDYDYRTHGGGQNERFSIYGVVAVAALLVGTLIAAWTRPAAGRALQRYVKTLSEGDLEIAMLYAPPNATRDWVIDEIILPHRHFLMYHRGSSVRTQPAREVDGQKQRKVTGSVSYGKAGRGAVEAEVAQMNDKRWRVVSMQLHEPTK